MYTVEVKMSKGWEIVSTYHEQADAFHRFTDEVNESLHTDYVDKMDVRLTYEVA